jgi:hypothetical protein
VKECIREIRRRASKGRAATSSVAPESRGNRVANQAHSLIKLILGWGVEEGYLTANPAAVRKLFNDKPEKRRMMSDFAMRTIWRALDEERARGYASPESEVDATWRRNRGNPACLAARRSKPQTGEVRRCVSPPCPRPHFPTGVGEGPFAPSERPPSLTGVASIPIVGRVQGGTGSGTERTSRISRPAAHALSL